MVLSRRLLTFGVHCVLAALLSGIASAQETKKSTETRSFEIISVDGNRVVYRGGDGAVKEVTVTDDFKINMNGQTLGVHDLKPGMKGTAVITTTTSTQPVTVTEVRNAKVLATAGNAIIVRGEDGTRKFTLDDVNDKNITILREGQRVDLSGLKVGDNLTATIITRHPPKVMTEREVNASVQAPPAPARAPAAAAPASAPASASSSASAPAPAPKHEVAAAPVAAKKMPRTGSQLPLLPLGGAAALLLASGLTLRRRLRNAS